LYLASSRIKEDHEPWLVESSASFHMTTKMEWFCKYERYDRGDVFLGDDLTTKIIGRRKAKLKLMYGRIRTLPGGVLHILGLTRNLISIRKTDDVREKSV
jgi:hypothetical protein